MGQIPTFDQDGYERGGSITQRPAGQVRPLRADIPVRVYPATTHKSRNEILRFLYRPSLLCTDRLLVNMAGVVRPLVPGIYAPLPTFFKRDSEDLGTL